MHGGVNNGKMGRKGVSYDKRTLKRKPMLDAEEARTYAKERAGEIQSGLNSNYPSFLKSMSQTQVTGEIWLGLPTNFCTKYLPDEDTRFSLIDENLKESNSVYLAKRTALSAGWRGFANEHGIVDGDAVVFHLIKPTTSNVDIVRSGDLLSGVEENKNKNNIKIDENCDNDQESESCPLMEEPSIGHLPGCGSDVLIKLKEELKQKTMEAERATEKLHSFMSCKVCIERDITTLLLPCMHLCLCKNRELRLHVCPICKTGKVSSVQIFVSEWKLIQASIVSNTLPTKRARKTPTNLEDYVS